MSKSFLLSLFAVMLSAAVAAGEGGRVILKPASNDGWESNSIIASVNGEAISLRDVLAHTREPEHIAYLSLPASELPRAILAIRRKAVDDMIDRKLIAADYHAGSFRIPAQDIDSEIDRLATAMGARSRSDFMAKLRSNGVDYAKMRRDVEEYMAIQLMLHRCCLAGNTTTPEDLYRYYEKHKDEFSEPDRVELAMILVTDSKVAEKISQQLKADPAAFADLAAKFTEGPGKDNGGRLGTIEVKRLRTEFAEAVKSFKEGSVFGPVKTAEGINFLKVIKFVPGSGNDYFSVLPRLREKFEKQKRIESYEKYKISLREKAVVRYFFEQEIDENKSVSNDPAKKEGR